MLCFTGITCRGQGHDVQQVWTLTSTSRRNIRVFWSNQHREHLVPGKPNYTSCLPCRGLWEDSHAEKIWGHKWQKILWCENRVVNLQRMICIPDLLYKSRERGWEPPCGTWVAPALEIQRMFQFLQFVCSSPLLNTHTYTQTDRQTHRHTQTHHKTPIVLVKHLSDVGETFSE